MSNKLLDLIKSSNARWVDFRFTDTRGKEQHISFPAHSVDEEVMEDGKMFNSFIYCRLERYRGIRYDLAS